MSHQDRRDPLPEDYQYPTHGVDCDCVTCRNDIVQQMDRRIADMVFEASKLPTRVVVERKIVLKCRTCLP